MSGKNKSRSKSQKLCARKFCKNTLTRRAKKNFPKVCKAIGILVKGLGSKKKFNMKKCARDMEKKVQDMCEKTNCNPSCTNVPNLDAKEIRDGFNKNMSVILKKVLKSAGAESGCYSTEQLKRVNTTIKDLQKSAKKKSSTRKVK
jgi:hypothetical protein